MKKSILFYALIIPIFGFAQSGFYLKHHQLATGPDTSEIYLCTYWLNCGYDSVFEIIMHSTDNGKNFSLRNKRYREVYPGFPSALFGDSTFGVIYECPDIGPDTFSVSFDTGMTLIRKYFHHPFEPASGCQPGEIYFRSYTTSGRTICRSTNYGSSFDTISIPNSLDLVDVGNNPGELYFEGYETNDTLIKIVVSLDYGATFEFHEITMPYHLYYDLRRGAISGEFYLLVYDAAGENDFDIYLATDYGNFVTYQTNFDSCGGYFQSYTAGRKPGTFYVARRSTWTPELLIDYSVDYGITFTTYTHYLDCTYTGIANTTKAKDIHIYPNPTSSTLNINLPIENTYYHLQLINIFGRVVNEQEIKPGSEKVIVDVSDIVEGFYIISLTTKDGQVVTKKVVLGD
jgi:hypothetical protein